MRIHILAHHTTGAGLNTVAQLCYRDAWDRKVLGLQDGFKPIATWDEKVTAAMHVCKQEKHLTNDGIPIGPRLPKRSFAAHTTPPTLAPGRAATLPGAARPGADSLAKARKLVAERRWARRTLDRVAPPPPPPRRRRRERRPRRPREEQPKLPTQSMPSPPPCACRKEAAWSQSRGLTAQRGPPRESAGGHGEGGDPPPPPLPAGTWGN